MDRKWHYFLVVNVDNMYSINYTMLEKDINNKMKGLISYTGKNCQEIFEENEIPFDMQKIFISVSILKNILCKDEIGYEYFTNIPIRINKNRYNDYSTNGEIIAKYPSFRFTNAKDCDDKDIINFLINLRKNNLTEKYLNSLGEIFQINIKTNENTLNKKK